MNPFVIGVAGPTCGGKSTACEKIREQVGFHVVTISQDRYYKGGNAGTNFDVPEALDFQQLISDLTELRSGKKVRVPRYDFSTHSRMKETDLIEPAPIIIVEGILIFCIPELYELFDLRVFVTADPNICLLRRLARDVKERGRNAEEVELRCLRDVIPSNQTYVMPSMFQAHITLMNNLGGQFIGVEVLMSHIKMKLAELASVPSVSE